MAKENKKIILKGGDYLKYLEFKKENSLFNQLNNSKKETKILIGVSLLIISIIIGIIMIIDLLTYNPTTNKYTWDGILMFLAISMGLAWIIHGFGFILIRR